MGGNQNAEPLPYTLIRRSRNKPYRTGLRWFPSFAMSQSLQKRSYADDCCRLVRSLARGSHRYDGHTPPSVAARDATTTTPIVFIAVGDPVGSELVASYTRPGRNLTGIGRLGVGPSVKQLELPKGDGPQGVPHCDVRQRHVSVAHHHSRRDRTRGAQAWSDAYTGPGQGALGGIVSNSVLVFAGAGASTAVNKDKFPTTVQFYERLPNEIKKDKLLGLIEQ